MMNVKERLLCLLLCALTALILVSCQPKKGENDTGTTDTKAASISLGEGPGGLDEIPWEDG